MTLTSFLRPWARRFRQPCLHFILFSPSSPLLMLSLFWVYLFDARYYFYCHQIVINLGGGCIRIQRRASATATRAPRSRHMPRARTAHTDTQTHASSYATVIQAQKRSLSSVRSPFPTFPIQYTSPSVCVLGVCVACFQDPARTYPPRPTTGRKRPTLGRHMACSNVGA